MVESIGLIEKRQNPSVYRPRPTLGCSNAVTRWQHRMAVEVVLNRQPDLLHVVFALNPSGCFSRLLNCWQQQSNQNRDDRDHHQEFDESKTSTPGCGLPKGFRIHWAKLQKRDTMNASVNVHEGNPSVCVAGRSWRANWRELS